MAIQKLLEIIDCSALVGLARFLPDTCVLATLCFQGLVATRASHWPPPPGYESSGHNGSLTLVQKWLQKFDKERNNA
eukprot:SAG31_NODE_4508_length_3178_cov_14.175706_4_plen_77_part_00